MAVSTEAGAKNKAQEPTPVENPGLWFSGDAYPPEAIRAGAQGRVVVRLNIDEHGTPSQCYVAVSAGNPDLDMGTCNVAMTRARFKPGRDERGRALPSTFLLPVRWVLPKDDRELDLSDGRRQLADRTIELSLDETGAVKACKVIRNEEAETGGVKPDICRGFPLDARPFGTPIRNGKPAPATVTMTMSAYMDAD
ncbi:MAG: energy transducer TonB [Sphingomonas sp.]|uniref:energy transducer TonB n=1 Tax=Sphingomonas sp. TaxID=28214 RepID=UPI003561B2D1